MSSPSGIFLATEFFMATILKLKVAKRQPFEKVSLEHCGIAHCYSVATFAVKNHIKLIHTQ